MEPPNNNKTQLLKKINILMKDKLPKRKEDEINC